ncbi:MAG TPA: hypothetical protein VHT24_17530 [Pseudacidobacterium sp.]|jgi:hypothetical protein|nr:hypothetical protein [Pseudacidobacterium sp.]
MRIVFLLAPVLFGLLPAVIARHKHRSFGIWWLYGAVLFPIACVHALFLHRDPGGEHDPDLQGSKKKCPYCKEWVRWELEICPACHLRFDNLILHGKTGDAASGSDDATQGAPPAQAGPDFTVSIKR